MLLRFGKLRLGSESLDTHGLFCDSCIRIFSARECFLLTDETSSGDNTCPEMTLWQLGFVGIVHDTRLWGCQHILSLERLFAPWSALSKSATSMSVIHVGYSSIRNCCCCDMQFTHHQVYALNVSYTPSRSRGGYYQRLWRRPSGFAIRLVDKNTNLNAVGASSSVVGSSAMTGPIQYWTWPKRRIGLCKSI